MKYYLFFQPEDDFTFKLYGVYETLEEAIYAVVLELLALESEIIEWSGDPELAWEQGTRVH